MKRKDDVPMPRSELLTQIGVPPRGLVKKSARSLVAATKRAGRSLIIAKPRLEEPKHGG